MIGTWNWLSAWASSRTIPPAFNWFSTSSSGSIPLSKSSYRFFFANTVMMVMSMVGFVRDSKVFYSIVILFMIYMMDYFFIRKKSPDLIFHGKPMLQNVSSSLYPNCKIFSAFYSPTFPMVCILAFASARKTAEFLILLVWPNFDRFLASLAGYFNHSPIIQLHVEEGVSH